MFIEANMMLISKPAFALNPRCMAIITQLNPARNEPTIVALAQFNVIPKYFKM